MIHLIKTVIASMTGSSELVVVNEAIAAVVADDDVYQLLLGNIALRLPETLQTCLSTCLSKIIKHVGTICYAIAINKNNVNFNFKQRRKSAEYLIFKNV